MIVVTVLSAALVIVSVGIHLTCLRSLMSLMPRIARFRHARVGLAVLGALVGHLIEIAVFGTAFFLLAATGLNLLTEPDFLKAVQDDFFKQLNGRTYKTLNDSSTNLHGKLDQSEMRHFECSIHSAMEHFGIKEH